MTNDIHQETAFIYCRVSTENQDTSRQVRDLEEFAIKNIASGKASELLQPGHHGSTFGGNPLACAAALTTINTIQAEGFLDRVTVLGERIMSSLRSELADLDHVEDIRGLGCMIGIELNKPCKSLFSQAMEKGLIINVTADSVVRLLPPFIMTNDEADQVVAILAPLIKAFKKD